ncbi:hypothetical protein [Bradyrhizobium sp. 157]|nr:hypothetical protein [Bradyrhizobium sp. 157]
MFGLSKSALLHFDQPPALWSVRSLRRWATQIVMLKRGRVTVLGGVKVLT